MRNIERIDNILNQLEDLWKQFPDLRLGQLIGNVLNGPTLYYIEDEQLIEALKSTYEKL